MKVILAAVNAKYIHSNLAVFSLRAYAAQHGQEAEIAEYTINHQPEHILMDLYKRKPDVLAFSCYIWNFEMILELAEEFSLLCPETDIWLGGPEVFLACEEAAGATSIPAWDHAGRGRGDVPGVAGILPWKTADAGGDPGADISTGDVRSESAIHGVAASD